MQSNPGKVLENYLSKQDAGRNESHKPLVVLQVQGTGNAASK